jgi:hypothetical protein
VKRTVLAGCGGAGIRILDSGILDSGFCMLELAPLA